ncbi:calcium-binding protein, partial [Bradyrhizobium sp. IC4059]
SRNGNDITLTFSSGGSIKLVGEDAGNATGLEQIVFGDGTTWSRQDLESAYIAQQVAAGATTITGFNLNNDLLIGTSGADTLSGLNGTDTLTGGQGNDSLDGGGNADTYVYSAGDGNDTITDAGSYDSTVDKLLLGAGLTPATTLISRNGNDITLTFSSGGSIKLVGEDAGNATGLEQIVFGDGTTWSRQDLESAYIAQQVAAGATTITGFNLNNDLLIGTSGADTLSGLNGTDTLTGGQGNDSLDGGGSADTYVYSAGDGNDTITDAASYDSNVDKLLLGASLVASDTRVGRIGNDVILAFAGAGGSIRLIGEANGSGTGIEQVVFGDGTTWSGQTLLSLASPVGTSGNNALYGTTGNDSFDGKGGSDLVVGQGGNDIYVFNAGYGRLEIDNQGGSSAHGELQLGSGLAAQTLWFKQNGTDLLIQGIGSMDQIKIGNWFGASNAQLSEIKLSDGNKLDAQLNQLVSAMAAFTVSNPGFDPATATQMPNDPSLQSAISTSWHS